MPDTAGHLGVKGKVVDRQGQLPIYKQLRAHVAERIRRGDMAPNKRLPSERALAEELGVSRMTVRRVVEELVREGLVYTTPGRGTFVAEPRLTRHLLMAHGLGEDLRAAGFRATSRVLAQTVQQAPADVAAVLKLPPGSSVVLVERLRMVDGDPLALQKAYLPHALLPGLQTLDFEERSLYATIREQYGLHMERADLTLEASEPSPREVDLLRLPEGKPVLVMVRISYLPGDTPVEYVRSTYRGDTYTFSLTLRDK